MENVKILSFETYVSIHKEPHRWLEEIGYGDLNNGMDTVSKIQFFIDGIKPNSGLDMELRMIPGCPDLRNNFDNVANFLGQSVHSNIARFNHHNNRPTRAVVSIRGRFQGRGRFQSQRYHPYNDSDSSTHSSNFTDATSSHSSSYWRGNFHGHPNYGRGFHRGSRGHGRFNNSSQRSQNYANNNQKGRFIDGRYIYDKCYSDHEYWNILTQKQRSYLHELRAQPKEGDNTSKISDISSIQ